MAYFDDVLRERQAERQSNELQQLATGTQAVNQGLSNPVLWAIVIGGLAAMPFTGGLSFAITIAAGIAMNGGPDTVFLAVVPAKVDAAAPGWGCIRILFALMSIAVVLVALYMLGVMASIDVGLLGR